MLELRRNVERVCLTTTPVLLRGETGVGKEMAARLIHRLGPLRERPFVVINCAALSPGVLESELFGHERGAFTGAVRSHVGVFEQADGGTLFLDEVGEMPPFIQAKLLRVLEDGEVRKVGAEGATIVSFRLISATNADLWRKIEEGTFRLDLYYRLSVVELEVPALRERKSDLVPLLVHFFRRRGLPAPALTPTARQALTDYAWPGNVRELENEVERIIALHPGCSLIDRWMLSPRIGGRSRKDGFDLAMLLSSPLAQALAAVEREMIRRTLDRTGGNKSEAARRLGLSRQGLLNKIKRHGLQEPAPAAERKVSGSS